MQIYSSDWLRISNKANKDVEIDINGVIGGTFWDDCGVSADQLRNELKAIQDIKAKKIIVNIDSLGGLVNHALSIHDELVRNSAEIEVRITGLTASAATVISLAGDTIKMSKNAMYLIHRAQGMAGGTSDQIREAADNIDRVEENLVRMYSERTKNSKKKVREWMRAASGMGEWWSAEEAKEKGFIDEIFDPKDLRSSNTPITNKIDLALFNQLKYPIPTMSTEKTNFIEEIKSSFQDLLTEIKNSFKNEHAVERAERMVNSKTEELRRAFEARLKEQDKEIAEKNNSIEEKNNTIGELNNRISEMETDHQNKVEELTNEITNLKTGKSGKPAQKDPSIGNKKEEEKDEFRVGLAGIVNRFFNLD